MRTHFLHRRVLARRETASGRLFLIGAFLTILCLSRLLSSAATIEDSNFLHLPEPGSTQLRILSPTVLELTLTQAKESPAARLTQWDFVSDAGQLTLPSPAQFVVTAGAQAVAVRRVGFKQRPLYAPLQQRDLRVNSQIYLDLQSPITEGQQVQVTSTNLGLIPATQSFSARMDRHRWSPVVHVNQEGYMASGTKKAVIGYYLGTLGELPMTNTMAFQLINSDSNMVLQGTLTSKPDAGYTFSPLPYQKVFEADFSSIQWPGEYRLLVPGLGVSFPFWIDDGIAAGFTRAYALGLYHQRCGTNNVLPYTRHTHASCHLALVDVPTMAFSNVNARLAEMSSDFNLDARHTAPQLRDVASSLHPFVNQGKINVSGGHHDAGDYSKYTINVAALIHSLVFSADVFPSTGSLDNLGLPESGNGKSDLLEEAKWEADFLCKLQDADGGFYFLVYPRDRPYENNVLPEDGDPQVVFPKTTAATAAAVAALAQISSSLLFKQQFPVAASNYLERAKRGWVFLQNAVTRHGRDGSYQKITHYGNEFLHDDEIAWAATELFLATGEEGYHTEVLSRFDPASPQTWRWGWWRMFESYGSAIRSYAFAVRTGRLPANRLNGTFLAKCDDEIRQWGGQQVSFAIETAYGTSFPRENKIYRDAGWYFSMDRAFDIAVAYQLNADTNFFKTIIGNLNFEAGCNPVNVSFISGLGWRPQREVVHQYAQNDRRVLPPTGLPVGNLQPGFGNYDAYGTELSLLCFPRDDAPTAPYSPYDIWADSYNTSTEFVVPQLGRSLGAAAFLMGGTSLKNQNWSVTGGQIQGVPAELPAQQTVTATFTVPGIDLSRARIIWESRDQSPRISQALSYLPSLVGPQWIEAEAKLPDGRRFLAVTNFKTSYPANRPANPYQSAPQQVTGETAAIFHLDNTLRDATGKQPDLVFNGGASFDQSNTGWMQSPSGAAARFEGFGATAACNLTHSNLYTAATTEIALEAMIYITGLQAQRNGTTKLLSLRNRWDASLELLDDEYAGLKFVGGEDFLLEGNPVQQALSLHQWHHLRISVDRTGYKVAVNGVTLGSMASDDFLNWSENSGPQILFGNFEGWIDEVVVKSYDGSVRVPVMSPAGGSYTSSVTVTLTTSTPGAAIRYTLDGTEPHAFSVGYVSPLILASNTILKARAFKFAMPPSSTATASFSIVPLSTPQALLTPLSRRLPNGNFEIVLSGQTGQRFYLQATSDFITWTNISTNLLTTTTSVTVVDSTANRFPSRFYRTLLAP